MRFQTVHFDYSLASSEFKTEASETVYLITGANGGIGLGLMTRLLQRPNTTIIASTRNITQAFLYNLECIPTTHISNRIWACTLPAATTAVSLSKATDWIVASAVITQHPSFHVDVLIACAGASPGYKPALETPAEHMRYAFEVNAVGPLTFFQTFHAPLMRAKKPKFVLISSSLGSIADCDASPCLAYGASKAAVNYLAAKIDREEKELISFAIHPGWVKTGMGQEFADSVGVSAPPLTVEESTAGVLEVIDTATKDSTSGKFLNYDGTILPW